MLVNIGLHIDQTSFRGRYEEAISPTFRVTFASVCVIRAKNSRIPTVPTIKELGNLVGASGGGRAISSLDGDLRTLGNYNVLWLFFHNTYIGAFVRVKKRFLTHKPTGAYPR